MTLHRTDARPFVVEMAGVSGVGKSTLTARLSDRLRAEHGPDLVAAFITTPPSLPPALPRFLRFTLTPRLVIAAARIALAPRSRRTPIAAFRRWSGAITLAATARRQDHPLVLMDQGLAYFTRGIDEVEQLPPALWPDLVLELVADRSTIARRRYTRAAPVPPRKVRSPEMRRVLALRVARRLQGIQRDEARDILQTWSEHHLRPRLDSDELTAALDQAASMRPLRYFRPKPAPIRDAITARGTIWRIVTTDASTSADDAVEVMAKHVTEALGTPRAGER